MQHLSKTVVNNLFKKKLKISLAESCTGGLLSSYITSIKGSSKVFNLGLVTYSNQSKNKILKVSKNTIKKYGAVSEQVCLSMAKNLFKISKTNIYVAITGIAGPGGATKNKPVGLVYISVGKGNKIKTNKYLLKNKGRSYIQKAIVKKSLELIIAIIK